MSHLVPLLEFNHSGAFLLERTEESGKKTNADTDDASVLARELGGLAPDLALALEQVGALALSGSQGLETKADMPPRARR
jgi:hypothetical protein